MTLLRLDLNLTDYMHGMSELLMESLSTCDCNHCGDCAGRYLCHCLQITEEVVVEAVKRFALQTVLEVRRHTGAGEGCTACHRRIRQVVEEVLVQSSSSAPICSVR